MTTLALLLIALGLADFAAGGLEGRPRSLTRAALSSTVATLLSLLLALWFGAEGRGALAFSGLLTLVTLVIWVGPRAAWPDSAVSARVSLAGLATGILVAFAAAPVTDFSANGVCENWFDAHAQAASLAASPEAFLLLIGCVLFVAATANGCVRAVLKVAGTEIRGGETRLKGGRYIGMLERLMIFGLALAGEPTAAALVISAKSLLRFPELQSVSNDKSGDSRFARTDDESMETSVDMITEYFLLGSLASWALALWPVLILR